MNRLHKDLTDSVIRGLNPQSLASEYAKEFNVSSNAAARLLYSEYSYFAAEANSDCLKDLEVEEFEVVGTLDGSTCGVCQDMDGKHFPMSELRTGINAPPFHVRCRCTKCPYFDDEFSKNVKRAARDENGKSVTVDNMTYKQWKSKFVVEKSAESGIIKSITIDDFKPIYEKGTISKECIDEIYNALDKNSKYFNKVSVVNIPKKSDGTIDLLRTNVTQKVNWADVGLEINEAVFKGYTLEEINERILNSHNKGHCVMKNLKEAVWHEIGHAKIMYGETYARAEAITDMLSDYHIKGISKTALQNGDECIAECYVLKMRREEIPKQAQQIYSEYMKE